MSGLADPRTTAAGRRFEQFRWPNGIIPFEIDPVSVHPTVEQNIRDAIREWDDQTILTFTPRVPNSPGDYLRFIVDPTAGGPFQGYSETVGRLPGRGAHVVHLGGQGTKLTALHEIGHVIGLYHEHQRADRNNHIRVFDGTNGTTNRIPASIAGNFPRYVDMPTGVYGRDGVDLPPSSMDFNSIMMYPSASSNPPCNPNPCMVRLNGTTWPLPSTLSPQDIDGVNRLYLAPIAAENIDTALTPARNIVLTSSGGGAR